MPLNPTGKKHRFGKAWMHEHVNDHYVHEAQRRGYRSRAAFKLLELDARDQLLRPGMTATATITATRRDNVLVVPNTALRFSPTVASASATQAASK